MNGLDGGWIDSIGCSSVDKGEIILGEESIDDVEEIRFIRGIVLRFFDAGKRGLVLCIVNNDGLLLLKDVRLPVEYSLRNSSILSSKYG